jgi:hypothetical protein
MPTKSEATVGQVVAAWLDEVDERVDLTDVTKRGYVRLMAHLLAFGGNRPFSRIDLRRYTMGASA